jgi:probable phosphoglycerate mutase
LTKVFLVRHAEAEGNIYRRANGHYNGLITARGYAQIEQLKARFDGVQIDVVYSSDLFRARTTATAISEPRGLPIHTTEKLREVGMGVWEDSTWGNLEYFEREMSVNFSKDPAKWSVNGSEPYDNVKKRMHDFITETAERHDGETIALLSHGFAIRAFMCHLMDIPSHETDRMPYCDNSAVTLLHYENNALKIEYHSDNSHLDPEISTLAHQTWWRTEKKWASENLRIVPLDEVRDKELLGSYYAENGERCGADREYTAFNGDNPVGIVGLDMERAGDSESVGWVSYIYISPDRRRKNYGTQLLGQAVSVYREQRREKLRIEVSAESPAVDFLKKREFEVVSKSSGTCLMEKSIRNW